MHRVQATTKDPSGWYLAASTHGEFSVLIPIPFNDFTVTDEDPKWGTIKIHTVGAMSSEGIKFSATRTPIIPGRTPTNLVAVPQQSLKRGEKISDVDHSSFAGNPSVSYSIKGPSAGAHFRHVETPKTMILLILQYPNDQAKTAEELRATFLSSLKINQPDEDRAKPGRAGSSDRGETNRTSSAGSGPAR